jgi:hypothetical protein
MKKYLFFVLLYINHCFAMENLTNISTKNKQDPNKEKMMQNAAKKIQNTYRKYKMKKNLEKIYQKIHETIYLEENKEPKLLTEEKDDIEQDIKEISTLINNTVELYTKLPMAKKINVDITTIKKTQEVLLQYLKFDRNMTAQYIAVALSNLLPIIFKIQQASVLALQASAYNPMIGQNGRSLAKKIFLSCLITSGIILASLWGMQAAGLIIVDFTSFIAFFEKALHIDQLTALFYG